MLIVWFIFVHILCSVDEKALVKKKKSKTTFPIIPCLKNYKYTDIN